MNLDGVVRWTVAGRNVSSSVRCKLGGLPCCRVDSHLGPGVVAYNAGLVPAGMLRPPGHDLEAKRSRDRFGRTV